MFVEDEWILIFNKHFIKKAIHCNQRAQRIKFVNEQLYIMCNCSIPLAPVLKQVAFLLLFKMLAGINLVRFAYVYPFVLRDCDFLW